MSLGGLGVDMKTGKLKANPRTARVYDIAVGCEISIPVSRRARLMGASAIAGGALRGLAVAAGMVTVFGASPALAQCFSGAVPFAWGRVPDYCCDRRPVHRGRL